MIYLYPAYSLPLRRRTAHEHTQQAAAAATPRAQGSRASRVVLGPSHTKARWRISQSKYAAKMERITRCVFVKSMALGASAIRGPASPGPGSTPTGQKPGPGFVLLAEPARLSLARSLPLSLSHSLSVSESLSLSLFLFIHLSRGGFLRRRRHDLAADASEDEPLRGDASDMSPSRSLTLSLFPEALPLSLSIFLHLSFVYTLDALARPSSASPGGLSGTPSRASSLYITYLCFCSPIGISDIWRDSVFPKFPREAIIVSSTIFESPLASFFFFPFFFYVRMCVRGRTGSQALGESTFFGNTDACSVERAAAG